MYSNYYIIDFSVCPTYSANQGKYIKQTIDLLIYEQSLPIAEERLLMNAHNVIVCWKGQCKLYGGILVSPPNLAQLMDDSVV